MRRLLYVGLFILLVESVSKPIILLFLIPSLVILVGCTIAVGVWRIVWFGGKNQRERYLDKQDL